MDQIHLGPFFASIWLCNNSDIGHSYLEAFKYVDDVPTSKTHYFTSESNESITRTSECNELLYFN